MSARARGAAPVVAVLALLAVISAVAWAVWGDGSRFAAAMAQPDPTPRLPYVQDTHVLVTPAGHVVFERVGTLAKFADSNLLTPTEQKIIEAGQATRIESVITRDDQITLGAWRFTVKDGVAPFELFSALDKHYENGGHKRVETEYEDVFLRRSANSYHAHYVRGQDVLRIEGYGKDADAVTAAVMELLDDQVERSPAVRPQP